MAFAQFPAYVVRFPPVAPPVKSAEVVLPSLCSIAPASEVGANAAVCLTGAAELGEDVEGPWQGRHSTSVLVSLPWWCCFGLVSGYIKVSIGMMQAALWGQHRSCLHPANFGVTILLC